MQPRLQLLKSQSPDETAFAYHTMGSNANSSRNTNILNDNAEPIINPQARIKPTSKNPRSYPLFDLRLVPNYTNNQLIYYYATGAISGDDQPRFYQLIKQRKTSLDLLK